MTEIRTAGTFGGVMVGKEHEGGFWGTGNILYLSLVGITFVDSLCENSLVYALTMCAFFHIYVINIR